jgi:ABC-type multidrug transport system fused ATPase/permease subunit
MSGSTSEKEEKVDIKEGLSIIWRRYLSPFRRELVVLSVLGLISAVATGFVPYVTGRFFDALVDISAGRDSEATLGLPVWILLLSLWALVQFSANSVDWIIDRKRRVADSKIHLSIQATGFLHLFRLPLAYHKNSHISGVLQSLSSSGWRIASILRTSITVAPQFLSVLIGIMLAASINALLAGVLLAGVAIYVASLVKILQRAALTDKEAHDLWNQAWDEAAQAVHQIESVKHGAAEQYEADRARKNFLESALVAWNRLEYIWSNVSFFQRIIVFFTQLVVFILSATFVISGTLTVGELIALNGYALMFFGPFVQLGHSWQSMQNGLTSAVHVEKIFAEPEEMYVPANAVTLEDAPAPIRFENVTFRYEKDQPMVLEGVDLAVKPGEIVALVGESGVGKSTTIGLISGYHFPTEGSVMIGGHDTRTITLESLRKQTAVVPQEVALFNDTIRTNIKYGSFDASDEEVKRAAGEAHISEFIEKQPRGYDTLVGERGIKLSVGQKQRVAIARAILRNPKILILDEPTSALDAATEKVVTEALERLMKGRTTFIIAHRLSTVRKADRILVFEKGKIVEEGKHDDLVQKENGVYRRLYEYQIGLH